MFHSLTCCGHNSCNKSEHNDGVLIATEEGLIWKIWTENATNKEAGGIYLFSDENNAKRYLEKHTKRLNSFGIVDINAKIFDVNVPLSLIDKANIVLSI